MPEGPEVKLFTEKINSNFKGKTLKKVDVLSGRYIKNPIENLFKLNGNLFKGAFCKGKFIWFDFGNNIVFNTLGMTGSWNKTKTKHEHTIENKHT